MPGSPLGVDSYEGERRETDPERARPSPSHRAPRVPRGRGLEKDQSPPSPSSAVPLQSRLAEGSKASFPKDPKNPS